MATSINIPALNNTIRTDIPAINAVIKALAKLDPSVLADLESGTKRIVEGSSGWEIQQYNGSSWVTLTQFNINAQQVDGFDASASVAANTIPVRNAEGNIPGNITGNAPTADKLNSTLTVNAGGTGATTAANARTNLGVPPTSHASTATTYGVSSATNYGHPMASSTAPKPLGTAAVGSETAKFARGDHVHPTTTATGSVLGMVKLSDSTTSTSAASAGIAASPKAVKAAYDLANKANTTANTANNAAKGKVDRGGDTMTGALNAPELHAKQPNVVKGTNPSSVQYAAYHFVDSTGNAGIANRLGTVEYSLQPNGKAQIIIGPYLFKDLTSYTGNLLTIGILSDGTAYTEASNLKVNGYLEIPGGRIWIA